MSVTIRLARIGKRNAPAFKVVVANTRDKRNGKFLDVIGHYNPSHNPVLLDINKGKFEDWKKKGALSTKAVEKLLDESYEFQPYTRQNEEKEEKTKEEPKEQNGDTAESPEEATEEATEETTSEEAEQE